MPRTVTKTVFQYDELTPKAQEKARDWFKELSDSSDFSNVIEEAETVGNILGIEFDRRNFRTYGGKEGTEPAIWWSLSYSQGDGACFEGRYSYGKGAPAKLAADYGGDDFPPTVIARRLQAIQKAHGYKLTARCKQTDHHYTHEHTISIDVEKSFDEWSEVPEASAKEVADCLRRFMKWIHEQLQAEDEYQREDDTVAENIRINEYEFEKDGTRTRD